MTEVLQAARSGETLALRLRDEAGAAHDLAFNAAAARALTSSVAVPEDTGIGLADSLGAEIEAIYAAAPVGIALLDTELRYLRINERLATLNGLPAEAHIGRRVRDVVPGLAQKVEATLRRVLAGEIVRGEEFSGDTGGIPGNRIWTESWHPQVVGGRVAAVVVVVEDVTERRRSEAALREVEARFRLALKGAPVVVGTQDRDLRYTWIGSRPDRRLTADTPLTDLVGKQDCDFFDAATVARLSVLKRTVIETGEPGYSEVFAKLQDGRERVFDLYVEPVRGADGAVSGIAITAADVTERKRTEERLALLAHEVDHRSKNIIALIQAMVRLTHGDTVPEFIESLNGRIDALSRVHGVLAAGRWKNADLREIVEQEVRPYRGAAAVTLEGPAVALAPYAAQSLALALHELATNAAKYGALREGRGSLAVRWDRAPGEALHLVWSERTPDPVAPPRHRGMGSALIEGSIAGQLGGSVSVDWADGGLVLHMHIPDRVLSRRTRRHILHR